MCSLTESTLSYLFFKIGAIILICENPHLAFHKKWNFDPLNWKSFCAVPLIFDKIAYNNLVLAWIFIPQFNSDYSQVVNLLQITCVLWILKIATKLRDENKQIKDWVHWNQLLLRYASQGQLIWTIWCLPWFFRVKFVC